MSSTVLLAAVAVARRARADAPSDEDVAAAKAELDAGRGWPAAVAAVEARRRAAGVDPATTSPRSLRRAFQRRGIVVRVPKVNPPHGHRPRKPPLSPEECKVAIAIARVRGRNGGPNWKGAADAVNALRGPDRRGQVSKRWLELQLRDRLEEATP